MNLYQWKVSLFQECHSLKIQKRKSSEKDNEISSSPLSWLHGVWESEEATVSYPTMDTIKYFERMQFDALSPILIDYKSESWNAETKEKMHMEKGYVKIHSDSGTVAFVVAHNFGLTELDEGSIDGQTLHLNSKYLSWITFTKLTSTKQVIRDFVLKDGVLYQDVQMETIRTPLQQHLKIRYRKKQ